MTRISLPRITRRRRCHCVPAASRAGIAARLRAARLRGTRIIPSPRPGPTEPQAGTRAAREAGTQQPQVHEQPAGGKIQLPAYAPYQYTTPIPPSPQHPATRTPAQKAAAPRRRPSSWVFLLA